MNTVTLESGQVLGNVHDEGKCAGENCCIHNPSNHSMIEFPRYWREDRGLMERICPHGVGHVDWDDPSDDRVHGCDGCCGFDIRIGHLPARWIQEGYAARSDGTIWSFWRPRVGTGAVVDMKAEPRQLKPRPNGKGYLRVQLGAKNDSYIQRIVWQAWRGEIDDGLEVRHLDGDKTNNALYNLKPGTRAENDADKDLHGTRPKGEAHANAKLTERQVGLARRLTAEGQSLAEVMQRLGLTVNKATLHEAVTGKTWAHLGPDPDTHFRPNDDSTHGCDGCCS